MLAEFALTPSLFDQDAQDDIEEWREQLRELATYMFPRGSGWPVMVSDLYDGSWFHTAKETVESIRDQRARIMCQGILRNVQQMLVHRPAVLDWPQDDTDWCKEAINSHCAEAIDRIVTTSCTHRTLSGDCGAVRKFEEVRNAGFWHGVSSDESLPMRIAEQVAVASRLCVHAEFFAVISPYIAGAGDDETDFALELARLAIRPSVGFPKADVEIHIEGPRACETGSSEYERLLENKVQNISHRFCQVLSQGETVNIVVWPRLRERLIIAGVKTSVGQDRRCRSPRWGISMNHIARQSDSGDTEPPTEWKLLKRDSLANWFCRYCEETAEGWLARRTIGR